LKPPSILDAKKLALELRARGAILLAFDGERFGMASYGQTRTDCDYLRGITDEIYSVVMEPVEEQGMGTEGNGE
jgi:hypothetical protein